MGDDNPHSGRGSAAKSWLERIAAIFTAEPQQVSDLEDIIAEANSRNLIDSDTKGMLQGVLDVSKMRARDIMVPRSQMATIDIDQPLSEFLPILLENNHSRYPVVNEDKDFRMIGYKLLLDNKNGTYSPGIYSYKKVLYTKGAETVEHAPPHLYVFPKKKQADDRLTSSGNKKVFEVSFNACDVMFASKTEIQVKKLMLEDETVLDTKVENDLQLLLEGRI